MAEIKTRIKLQIISKNGGISIQHLQPLFDVGGVVKQQVIDAKHDVSIRLRDQFFDLRAEVRFGYKVHLRKKYFYSVVRILEIGGAGKICGRISGRIGGIGDCTLRRFGENCRFVKYRNGCFDLGCEKKKDGTQQFFQLKCAVFGKTYKT